jgi:hypothetical protein
VTEETPVIPAAIERGLLGVRSLPECEVEGEPRFDSSAKRWVVKMSLKIEHAGPFIGSRTKWCVLLDATYPFGRVAVHPASDGGMTVTFPHQERNAADRESRGWRGGKLCVDSPFCGERLPTSVRDPFGDAEARLRWHVERALDWLDSAAAGRLIATGDPFEVPSRPYSALKGWAQQRLVHDESVAGFSVWAGRENTMGVARLGVISEIGNAIGVAGFDERNGTTIRTWAGRQLSPAEDGLSGVWWLWPDTIVVPPWQCPGTWGELRRAGKSLGVDVDAMLFQLAPAIRGTKTNKLLLLGYPIPTRVGAPPREVHWDAVLLPRLLAPSGTPPSGFRPNSRGWWHRDRHSVFADKMKLEYLHTENWSGGRLQARGRLSLPLRDSRIAILGVGALGSCLAEQLVRTGLANIALLDGDFVAAGNVCRHMATLVDVGKTKVRAVAHRLLQISPSVQVIEVDRALGSGQRSIVEALEPYDLVVDCTASDDALALLAGGWWSIPRVFASFSMGFCAKRLYSFGVTGHAFPQQRFTADVTPWLQEEAATWADSEELLEGAGCWSPLFPARYDDVVLAAAVCVKEIEALTSLRPREPRFRVFEKQESAEGFQGFSVNRDWESPEVTVS